ncbi:hypothetical protein [Flavobacterium sp.]|uniref:hypothetical protein n=1 Tax=Flavobacterium sp. TaxID=239 RepID=UPI00261B1A70|nr:hypothetical protein [Flavobacterium sp.]
MRTRNLLLGVALIALGFTSCKDDKQMKAEKSVDTYVVYVDSLGNVSDAEAQANWDEIDAAYQLRASNAELALEDLKDKEAAQARIDASRAKYEALKAKMEAENQTEVAVNAEGTDATVSSKQKLRNALFGEGKIGEDMSFAWVNKDNIRGVYSQFVGTVEQNKDSYSREDWDEIKIMYEALDSRKNTVEKEGLSGEDNKKIAGLKMKFAPMLTVNRMGAKSEETQKAKS